MAGTYNAKTGYLDVTGLNVQGGKIVVQLDHDTHYVDSEWVISLIDVAISNMNIDSDVVANIANNVRLNDLIDSDAIAAIAAGVSKDLMDSDNVINLLNEGNGKASIINLIKNNFSDVVDSDHIGEIAELVDFEAIMDSELLLKAMYVDNRQTFINTAETYFADFMDSDLILALGRVAAHQVALDSDEVAKVANNELTLINQNIVNFDSDIEFIYRKLILNDSDLQLMRSKYYLIDINDQSQDIQLAQHDSDIDWLSRRVDTAFTLIRDNDSDILAIQNHLAGIDIDDSDTRIRLEQLETNVGIDRFGSLTGGGHENRIGQLETTYATLNATVTSGLTIGDDSGTPTVLADVDVSGLQVGYVLQWNGVNWIAVDPATL